MNWIYVFPPWISFPVMKCFGPNVVGQAAVSYRPPVSAQDQPATFWWLLLIAMFFALIGTYLGAWQDKARVKLMSYSVSGVATVLFMVGTYQSLKAHGFDSFGGLYAFALGNFDFWLALSLPMMLAAIVVQWRWPGEPGKIASSVFSEYLSFLCLCWMFFAFALHNCT